MATEEDHEMWLKALESQVSRPLVTFFVVVVVLVYFGKLLFFTVYMFDWNWNKLAVLCLTLISKCPCWQRRK